MGGDGEECEVRQGGESEVATATATARADREASSWWLLSVAGGRQGGRDTRTGSNAGFVFLIPVPLLTTD
jgi:hypothetical protein